MKKKIKNIFFENRKKIEKIRNMEFGQVVFFTQFCFKTFIC